jgi:iron complex outermembrane receptor protein
MFKKTKVCTGVLVALGGTMMVGALPAWAQSSERIEVTGSRIRQIESETAQPILKITQEQIQQSGLVTVGDIVNSLSSSGTPAFSKGAVLTANREQGGQYVDMRNLGAQRVLVLVNGKRWSQTVAGYTDLSTIPSALVERLEILKDGASSIYGSDAISGVLNFILKKSLTGGEFSFYMGQNEKGDGKTKDASIAYGVNSDKGSMMFAATFSKVEPVWARSREITKYTYGPDHPTSNLGVGPYGRIRNVTATGAAGSAFNGTSGYFLNHAGDYNSPGAGTDSSNPANYHNFAGAANDAYNTNQDVMFLSPTQLSSIFAKGTLELSPSMRFTSTASYSSRTSTRQVAGYPLNSLSQSGYPVYIDKDNYYNPYGNRVAGAGLGQDLFFYRRTIEVPRTTKNDSNTFHLDAALEGDLSLGGLAWNWNVGANYSNVSGTVLGQGNVNLVNLKKALGPSFKNAAGNVVCGTAAAPIGGCVPFDILGGPSASTAEALAYVMSTGQATYGSTVSSLNADISGEVFKLPAGAIGLAAGVERRQVRGYDRPGQFEQSGLSTDLAGNATVGNYTVNEVYAEVNVPILKGIPFVDYLAVNASVRHSDYSTYGKTDRSKFSFQYRPIKDAMLRGTVAEGFRAPTIGDISGGGSQSFDSYLDPCDSRWGNAASDPAVAARCAAAGVPANFRQTNQSGAQVTQAGAQTVFPFTTSAGNVNLLPETAITKTVGLVISPSALAGLTVSLDWFRIDIKNKITGISTPYVLNQCYVQANTPFCSSIVRDATGTITKLTRGSANLGQTMTQGIDIGLNYRFPAMPLGQFAIRSDSTYLNHYRVLNTTTGNWTEYAGSYDGSAFYRFKSNIGLDWSMGAFSVTLGTRYYSSIKTQCWDTGSPNATPPAPGVECSNPTKATGVDNSQRDYASFGEGYDRKSAKIYNDLSLAYKTSWKGTIRVGANNVFNQKPYVNYSANSVYQGNSSIGSVDPELPIDRFFYVRYSQTF